MEYNFKEIEPKWQKYWSEKKTFKANNLSSKPKYYVLDMFPYPSGAGLHVGHPLGYIASDIYSRFKRHQGYNVLHPMGFDAFGLPAEQYAVQTGQHPALTTRQNIKRYRQQLDRIGFSFDWDREVQTCDPFYYKWTQWTFIQLFHHWYNKQENKAMPIELLMEHFKTNGSANLYAANDKHPAFTAEEWISLGEYEQEEILMKYRLAYQSETLVNWCPALGTVLANDEVKDGYSVRGNHPVERKPMKQWLLRVSAYADRLLNSLERLDWSDSLKEIQRNWIGRSEGATLYFEVFGSAIRIEVFTTRADTLFGSTFLVLAPEHTLVDKLTIPAHQAAVKQYVEKSINRTERERMTEVKKVSGEFTGSYAINPFTRQKMPVYIADYVLSGYGTGAIMAVPAHDSRDYAFARHFNLPIVQVVNGGNIENEAYEAKTGKMINSDFLNGMEVPEAIAAMSERITQLGIGEARINYRIRDAIFSRQRYWGEPFPVFFRDGIAQCLNPSELPLELPEIDAYQPTETGEPPLARAKGWKTKDGHPYETSTMPGFAGSSGYYLRYMDPDNDREYFAKPANEYWRDVDLYIGGAEHAAGHLVYSRFWNKFLYDMGLCCEDEPFKKLINQGMIQGRSNFVYRANMEKYAEYLLWQEIKDSKLGVEFKRNYKDGHRQFDFYCPDHKLIIEIKSQAKLEKLVEPYSSYIREKGLRLMLFPIIEVRDNTPQVLKRIQAAIEGKELSLLEPHEIIEFPPLFVSKNYPGREEFTSALHVDINIVHNDILDIEAFKSWRTEYQNAVFLTENGKYYCGWEIEKMSKSLHNVQNPDDLIDKYGADTLRLYEMFLGPLEQSKPWDTNGIEGVFRFQKKLWRLFHDQNNKFVISEDVPKKEELKTLHQAIKKVNEDIERFSFNTAVSTFMICVNELGDLKCNKRQILQPLVILLSPFAPHICEELWSLLGHEESIEYAPFPKYDNTYLSESTFLYPVSFNGKMRFKLELPIDFHNQDIEKAIMESAETLKWTDGKPIKKLIIVKQKIINIVF